MAASQDCLPLAGSSLCSAWSPFTQALHSSYPSLRVLDSSVESWSIVFASIGCSNTNSSAALIRYPRTFFCDFLTTSADNAKQCAPSHPTICPESCLAFLSTFESVVNNPAECPTRLHAPGLDTKTWILDRFRSHCALAVPSPSCIANVDLDPDCGFESAALRNKYCEGIGINEPCCSLSSQSGLMLPPIAGAGAASQTAAAASSQPKASRSNPRSRPTLPLPIQSADPAAATAADTASVTSSVTGSASSSPHPTLINSNPITPLTSSALPKPTLEPKHGQEVASANDGPADAIQSHGGSDIHLDDDGGGDKLNRDNSETIQPNDSKNTRKWCYPLGNECDRTVAIAGAGCILMFISIGILGSLLLKAIKQKHRIANHLQAAFGTGPSANREHVHAGDDVVGNHNNRRSRQSSIVLAQPDFSNDLEVRMNMGNAAGIVNAPDPCAHRTLSTSRRNKDFHQQCHIYDPAHISHVVTLPVFNAPITPQSDGYTSGSYVSGNCIDQDCCRCKVVQGNGLDRPERSPLGDRRSRASLSHHSTDSRCSRLSQTDACYDSDEESITDDPSRQTHVARHATSASAPSPLTQQRRPSTVQSRYETVSHKSHVVESPNISRKSSITTPNFSRTSNLVDLRETQRLELGFDSTRPSQFDALAVLPSFSNTLDPLGSSCTASPDEPSSLVNTTPLKFADELMMRYPASNSESTHRFRDIAGMDTESDYTNDSESFVSVGDSGSFSSSISNSTIDTYRGLHFAKRAPRFGPDSTHYNDMTFSFSVANTTKPKSREPSSTSSDPFALPWSGTVPSPPPALPLVSILPDSPDLPTQ